MPVTKTVDISASSPESIEAAIDEALARAELTIRDITEFEVAKITGAVSDAGVKEYRAHLRITFVVRERALHE